MLGNTNTFKFVKEISPFFCPWWIRTWHYKHIFFFLNIMICKNSSLKKVPKGICSTFQCIIKNPCVINCSYSENNGQIEKIFILISILKTFTNFYLTLNWKICSHTSYYYLHTADLSNSHPASQAISCLSWNLKVHNLGPCWHSSWTFRFH
jgi:hypothetical protein